MPDDGTVTAGVEVVPPVLDEDELLVFEVVVPALEAVLVGFVAEVLAVAEETTVETIIPVSELEAANDELTDEVLFGFGLEQPEKIPIKRTLDIIIEVTFFNLSHSFLLSIKFINNDISNYKLKK